MNNINYAQLYGVKQGEIDFSGAIKRCIGKIKENGLPHLNNLILKINESKSN